MSHSISTSFSRAQIDLEQLYAEARHEISTRDKVRATANEALTELKVTLDESATKTQLDEDCPWFVVLDEKDYDVEVSDFFSFTAEETISEPAPRSEFRRLVETLFFGLIGLAKGF